MDRIVTRDSIIAILQRNAVDDLGTIRSCVKTSEACKGDYDKLKIKYSQLEGDSKLYKKGFWGVLCGFILATTVAIVK